ncbi:MAG TPA: hypothetical protein VFT68_05180, partial [Lapillicoccus sp.]|nr:hypothetical protein [Lapillicoccus sp.]
MPRAAWQAWREPGACGGAMVSCARHTPLRRTGTRAESYLEAGIWVMTASATSRIPSRRSIAVFWIH